VLDYQLKNTMADSNAPVQAISLNADNFQYSQPYPNKSGTITSIYMNYNNSRPKIQSPMMYAPFGISVMVDEKNPNRDPGFSIDCQLAGKEGGHPKLVQFTDWLETVDVRVLADCKKNCKKWLGRAKISDRMAKDKFGGLVKPYKDPNTKQISDKYPPRTKFKFQRKDGNFTTTMFDHRRQPIDLNSMTLEELKGYGKGHRFRVIFELGGIWSGSKGFGLTLRAKQLMIYPPQKLTGFGFVHDVEDDLILGTAMIEVAEEDMNTDNDEDTEPVESGEFVENNSDEEEGEGEEEENNSDEGEEEEEENNSDEGEEEEEEENNSDEEEEPVAVEPVKKKRETKKAAKN